MSPATRSESSSWWTQHLAARGEHGGQLGEEGLDAR